MNTHNKINRLPKPIIRKIVSHGVLPEISQLNKYCYAATRLLLYRQNIQKHLFNKSIMTAILTPRNILTNPERVILLVHYVCCENYEFAHLVIGLSPRIAMSDELMATLRYIQCKRGSNPDYSKFKHEMRYYEYDDLVYKKLTTNTDTTDIIITIINQLYQLVYYQTHVLVIASNIERGFNWRDINPAAVSITRQINRVAYCNLRHDLFNSNPAIIDAAIQIYMNDGNPYSITYANDLHRFKKLLSFDKYTTVLRWFDRIGSITNPECIKIYLKSVSTDIKIEPNSKPIHFDNVSNQVMNAYVNTLTIRYDYHILIAISLLNYIKRTNYYTHHIQTLSYICKTKDEFANIIRDTIIDMQYPSFLNKLLKISSKYGVMLFDKYMDDYNNMRAVFTMCLQCIVRKPYRYYSYDKYVNALGKRTIEQIIYETLPDKYIDTALELFNI